MASASNGGVPGYIAVEVGASDSFLLVDSGATLSAITKQLWLDITKGGCRMANSVCDLLALTDDFWVADALSQDILLGFDFQSKYAVVLDFGKNECCIMGKMFPLTVPAHMD